MSSNWTIRPATIEDSTAIVELHSKVSQEIYHTDGHPASIWEGDAPSWWKWWNLDNPTGQSYSVVAEDAGKIVGHDGSRGVWMNFNGEKKLAAFNWGVMTHPDYMRQGINSSLFTQKHALEAQDGAYLSFGSTGELGRISGLAHGYYDLGYPKVLMKILNPQTIVAKKTGSRAIAAISGVPLDLALRLLTRCRRKYREPVPGKIVEIHSFDRRFDDLWAKLKDTFTISVWKDSEYLNWRYIARPNAKYHILAVEDGEVVYGFIVLRYIDSKYRTGHIVDLLFLHGKETYASRLVDRAVDYLREGGADITTCHLVEHTPYYNLLTSSGFLPRGCGGFWVAYNTADIECLEVLDRKNWFLTSGDSDGI